MQQKKGEKTPLEKRLDRIYAKVVTNEKGEYAYTKCFVCEGYHKIPVRKDRYGHTYTICNECGTVTFFKNIRSRDWLMKRVIYEKGRYYDVV
jgi:hypothetical protein